MRVTVLLVRFRWRRLARTGCGCRNLCTRRRLIRLRRLARCRPSVAEHVTHIEEGDIEHKADDQQYTASLDDLEHPDIHRFAADGFNDGQGDMPAIEYREREHVDQRQ